jgi:fibronectin type 3 domain-containing protein
MSNKAQWFVISLLFVILTSLLAGTFFITKFNFSRPQVVLSSTTPDNSLKILASGFNIDSYGNYIFPLGSVTVLLNLTSGGSSQVDSIGAVLHYDPTIVSAQSVSFNQPLSTSYLINDAMKCNPIYIQKDSSGVETGTIRIARTAIPLPSDCNLSSDSIKGLFPTYTPIPAGTSGNFASITFTTLRNTTTPYLISYDLRSSFPNFVDTLNDSNVPAYVTPAERVGRAADTLGSVTNLSFVVGGQSQPSDTTPPSVSITNPLNGANLSGSINVTANANDNVAVSKVEFSLNGALKCTDTSAPYECLMDTTTITNSSAVSISAKAFDTASTPNTATNSVSVSVCNGDCQNPTAPTNLIAVQNLYNSVVLGWNASTDNVAVQGYKVYRKNSSETTFALLGTATSTSYTDNNVSPSTAYQYYVKAFDSANNLSAASNVLSVTTPAATIVDTTPPTVPGSLSANAVSTTQINLAWNASTDNIGGSGLAGYYIYRSTSGQSGSFTKLNSTVTTSLNFGDSGLTPSTTYWYYVTALDNANNESSPSTSISETTLNLVVASGAVAGTVSDNSNSPILKAKVVLTDTTGRTKSNTFTDASGHFGFTDIAPGNYTLTFSYKNYVSQTFQISVINGQTIMQNVVMTR